MLRIVLITIYKCYIKNSCPVINLCLGFTAQWKCYECFIDAVEKNKILFLKRYFHGFICLPLATF